MNQRQNEIDEIEQMVSNSFQACPAEEQGRFVHVLTQQLADSMTAKERQAWLQRLRNSETARG